MKALLKKEALILALLAASSGVGCGTGGMAAGEEQAAAAQQEEFVFGAADEETSPAAPDGEGDSGDDGGARPAPTPKQRPAGRGGEEEISSDSLTMRCRGGRDCIKTGTVGETLRWEFKVRDAASPAWSIEEAQTIPGLRFGSAGDKAWIEGMPETSGIGRYTVRVCDGGDGPCVEREAEIKIADDFRVELATTPEGSAPGSAGGGAIDTAAFGPSHPLEIRFRKALLIEVQGFAPRYDIELLRGGESLKLVAATATRALLTVKEDDDRGAVLQASIRIRSHDYQRTEQVIELPPLKFLQDPCLVGFRIQSDVGPINSSQDWRNRVIEFRAAGNVGPVTWELADDYVAVGEQKFGGYRSCEVGEASNTTLNVTCRFGYGNAPLPPTITDKAKEVREVLVIRAQDAACPGSAPVEGIFQFKLFPDLRRVRVRDLSVWLSLSGNDNAGSGSKRAGATMDVILKGERDASAQVRFSLQGFGNDTHWSSYQSFEDDDDELSLADIKKVSLRIRQDRPGDDEADLHLDVNYLVIFGDHYFALFDDREGKPGAILDDNACRGEVFRDDNIFEPDEPEAARYDVTSSGHEGLIIMDITPFFAGFDVSEQEGTPPAEVNCMQTGHPRSIWQRNPMPYSRATFISHIIMSYPSYITRPED